MRFLNRSPESELAIIPKVDDSFYEVLREASSLDDIDVTINEDAIRMAAIDHDLDSAELAVCLAAREKDLVIAVAKPITGGQGQSVSFTLAHSDDEPNSKENMQQAIQNGILSGLQFLGGKEPTHLSKPLEYRTYTGFAENDKQRRTGRLAMLAGYMGGMATTSVALEVIASNSPGAVKTLSSIVVGWFVGVEAYKAALGPIKEVAYIGDYRPFVDFHRQANSSDQ